MSDRILVAYATCTGSTAGVAEAIAQTLRDSGAQVDVRLVHEVTSLAEYDAVVIGSAIQNKQWLPEAMVFVQEHREELNRKPFAAFLVCMTMAMKNVNATTRTMVADWLVPVRALVPTVAEGAFAGTLYLNKIPDFWARLGFRISVWTGVWKEGDHRDWNAIRAWAAALPTKFS
ncbi:MAG: flavodoxin domain-containing protein [Chloroflexi bacterium]|nr:flavodoxin domain-containing protein [Chloroflexota bacterium]